MIKVNELRIGNLVLYAQDNDILPVLKINGDAKTVSLDLLLGLNMELKEQDIDPIPLTPEWLERCGFVKKYSAYLQGVIYMYEGPGYWNNQKGWPVGLRDEISMRIIRCVDYVHQLQNLYFALTGEELQIKMP